MISPPPRSTLFPYTTLFRSVRTKRCERPTARRATCLYEMSLGLFHVAILERDASEHDVAIMKVLTIQVVSLKEDRKSTRLNSSHQIISYAVFCLKKKKKKKQ